MVDDTSAKLPSYCPGVATYFLSYPCSFYAGGYARSKASPVDDDVSSDCVLAQNDEHFLPSDSFRFTPCDFEFTFDYA